MHAEKLKAHCSLSLTKLDRKTIASRAMCMHERNQLNDEPLSMHVRCKKNIAAASSEI